MFPLRLPLQFSHFFLLKPTVNSRAAVGTTEAPWAGLFSCCCSVAQLCPTFCDPMDRSTPGFPVLQHLLEPGEAHASTHVHWMGDAIFSSAVSWSCLHKGFPKESAFHIKWPNTGAIASASFVFWCYKCCKVYKNGKYFISIALVHWKIFGVHIRYIKIRRTMAPERLTIKQSSPKILPMNILGWFPLGLTGLISL